jgi:hypothetical protein
LLTEALALAESGVAVFPCGDDKAPRTVNGFKDATTDAETIRGWTWDGMIGAPIPDGQVVIDIDPRNGGEGTIAAFKTAGLEFPPTKRVRTKSGGTHIYLTTDEAELVGKLGPGVDVKRAGKGYVIVPPSAGYKQFAFTDPAPMPDWLTDVLKGKAPATGESLPPSYFEQFQKGTPWGVGALQRQVGAVFSAREGERNDTLFKSACALARVSAGGELQWDEAREQLAQAALHVGLEPDEIRGTIENGWVEGSKEPRTAPNAPLEAEASAQPFSVALPESGGDDETKMWTDWNIDEPEPPWYVKPLLPKNAYVLVYGATEASKSMVWNGIGATLSHEGFRVSVYSLENPPHTDRDRLRRLRPSTSHFRLTNRVLDLADTRQLEAMRDRERGWGTDLIILDTYSHAFNSYSDDGNAKAIDFARRVRWLMQEVGCSVVVIDHTGYTRDDEPRDASAKRQQVDVAILMRKIGEWSPGQAAAFVMENKKAARFGNPFTINGQIRDTDGGKGLEVRLDAGRAKIEWGKG